MLKWTWLLTASDRIPWPVTFVVVDCISFPDTGDLIEEGGVFFQYFYFYCFVFFAGSWKVLYKTD